MSYDAELELSSPDPLSMSKDNIEASPTKLNSQTSHLTPRKALIQKSENLRLQDFYLTTPPPPYIRTSSPSKVVAQTENPISPWRIRVIVEAEREDSAQDVLANQNTFKTNLAQGATTTKVPLNDADGPSSNSPRKSRGRPRKSLESSAQRNGTPKAKAVRRHTAVLPVSAKLTGKMVPQAKSTPKKARGRPRKSLDSNLGTSSSHSQIVTPPGNSVLSNKIGGTEEPTISKRSVTSPQEAPNFIPKSHEIRDEANIQSVEDTEQIVRPEAKNLKRKRSVNRDSSSDAKAEQKHVIAANIDTTCGIQSQEPDTRKRSRYKNQGQSIVPNIGKNADPTEKHHEFDSILESEGFSMVSVSSLPSAKVYSSISNDLKALYDSKNLQAEANNEIASLLDDVGCSVDDQATNQKEVSVLPHESCPLSSRNRCLEKTETPSGTSPSVAAPPALHSAAARQIPRSLDIATDGTPKIDRVVRTGIALQGALCPGDASSGSFSQNSENLNSTSLTLAKPSEEHSSDLFSGFGAGTRRELRAGLRLGEELAKRQQNRVLLKETAFTQEDNVSCLEALQATSSGSPDLGASSVYSSKGLEPDQIIAYPLLANVQLPSPKRSEGEYSQTEDRMSWKQNTPTQTKADKPYIERSLYRKEPSTGNNSALDNTMMAREAEYQRDRDDVIKQIQEANLSKVIIIESEAEDDCQDEGYEESDIWQAQARSSDTLSAEPPEKKVFQNGIKPRRSRLPSPWQQQQQSPARLISQKNIEESDSFWQPGRKGNIVDRNESQKAAAHKPESTASSPSTNIRKDGVGDHDEPQLKPTPEVDQTQCSSSSQSITNLNSSINWNEEKDMDPDESYDETWEPSTQDSLDSEEFGSPTLTEEIDNSFAQSLHNLSAVESVDEKKSESNQTSTALERSSCSQKPSSSWLSYLTSFLPAFTKPAPISPKPPKRHHLLPNGKRRLPIAISEGFLSLYTPWTTNHWKALYVHYAAWQEGRAKFQFNPKSALKVYPLLETYSSSGWCRRVTKGDVAIADAFFADLRRRRLPSETGFEERELISPPLVLEKLFVLWIEGVMDGECEVGDGTTGLARDGKRQWKPELEAWFRKD